MSNEIKDKDMRKYSSIENSSYDSSEDEHGDVPTELKKHVKSNYKILNTNSKMRPSTIVHIMKEKNLRMTKEAKQQQSIC